MRETVTVAPGAIVLVGPSLRRELFEGALEVFYEARLVFDGRYTGGRTRHGDRYKAVHDLAFFDGFRDRGRYVDDIRESPW